MVADFSCDINASNLNQIIDFGVIGIENLKVNNPSSEVPFEITLEIISFKKYLFS